MAKAIVTIRSGAKVTIKPTADEDFFVTYPGEDNTLELPQASNTRRRGNFYSSVRGLFTLDGSQDTQNEEGSTTSVGVNFREPITTNLRGYTETGSYIIINAVDVVSVEVLDD